MIARKVEDEIRRTENTILRALSSLSKNSLNGDVNSMSLGTTLRGEESGQDCFESYGLDSDQENVIPESVFADYRTEVRDK